MLVENYITKILWMSIYVQFVTVAFHVTNKLTNKHIADYFISFHSVCLKEKSLVDNLSAIMALNKYFRPQV
jgi:hypothetical protein